MKRVGMAGVLVVAASLGLRAELNLQEIQRSLPIVLNLQPGSATPATAQGAR